MDSRWRRQLRRAEQHKAFSVRFLTDIDERLACFDAFSAMYSDLKARKGFGTGFNCGLIAILRPQIQPSLSQNPQRRRGRPHCDRASVAGALHLLRHRFNQ
jgi:hypothetical protein